MNILDNLHGYEKVELEGWVEREYPDMAREFARRPKTLANFIAEQYPYLIQEFIEAERIENIVYCT